MILISKPCMTKENNICVCLFVYGGTSGQNTCCTVFMGASQKRGKKMRHKGIRSIQKKAIQKKKKKKKNWMDQFECHKNKLRHTLTLLMKPSYLKVRKK